MISRHGFINVREKIESPICGEPMFRILVVDDNPTIVFLLRETMKDLKHRHSLYDVDDGLAALDFLSRRGQYANAPRPDLILLSMNMKYVSGLDVLRRIKADPELHSIPAVVLSTSVNPADARKAYDSQANCYLQKPSDLERTCLLVQAIKTLWMDFAFIPKIVPPSRTKTALESGCRNSGDRGTSRVSSQQAAVVVV